MHRIALLLAVSAAIFIPQSGTTFAQPAPAATVASDDARLTAYLDAEFARDLKLRPQLATRLGMKDGQDRLDDISDVAQLQQLAARRDSVARMKADFDRSKLSLKGQANFDIWETELQRMELQYKYRRYQPPFYSFLYSVHAQLPDFLINTHSVSDGGDMRAYNARQDHQVPPGRLSRRQLISYLAEEDVVVAHILRVGNFYSGLGGEPID